MSTSTEQLVERVATLLANNGKKLATAESCTGGLIAKSLTDLAGSSAWFDRGFVTYSNEAKSEMLAVPKNVIEEYGAVSEPVANAMVSGALQYSAADFAIAVTGVAGPGGGSVEKPVGTVWIGAGSAAHQVAQKFLFPGDRATVREETMMNALKLLLAMLQAGK